MSDEQKRFIWGLYRQHRRGGGESRDYLPYSHELGCLLRQFNQKFGEQLEVREFWRLVINTLRMKKRARQLAGIV